jgi:hypothetical protein
VALDTTVGGASAESYPTLNEAKTYNSIYASLYPLAAAAWVAAADPLLENSLRVATRLLDANPRAWAGTAVDAVQALGFPRVGLMTRNGFPLPSTGAAAIPSDLKNATAELARQLLVVDRTADNAVINQALTGLTAGSVSLTFDSLKMDNSLQVPRIMRQFAAFAAVLPDAVKYLIPDSWLKIDVEDPRVRRVMQFETF